MDTKTGRGSRDQTVVISQAEAAAKAASPVAVASPQSERSLEAEVARIDDERRNAYLQGDAAALDRILADDVTAIAGIGVADSKASILADVRSRDLTYKKLTYDQQKIRIYGDTAVVTSHAEVVANYKDKDLSGELLVTRVYAKQQGAWKLVAIQSTRIPQPVSAGESPSPRGESGSIRDRFTGVWELASAEYRLVDGSTRAYPPAGPNGKGYLVYTADGHMCVELMNPDRPKWKDSSNPTEKEKISAFDGFSAYCGTYEIEETKSVIYHLADVARRPDVVGARVPHPYTFHDGLLTFSDKVTSEPGVESYSITWRKVATSAGSSSNTALPSQAPVKQTPQPMRGELSSIRDRFIGTWELVSAEDHMTDGSTRPYPATGPNGKGYLMYTADGHMCAELMNPDRPAWKDPRNPSDAEKASAIDGFHAYCGRYEIDEADRVMYHYPEIAGSPNYVGTKQPRPYKFNGDLLTFSDKVTNEPGVESYSITWRKVGAVRR